MYSRYQLARKYIHYFLTASNGRGHGIHSPFVYDFVRNVLNDKRNFYAYKEVEALRKLLLRDKTVLEVEDYGAGSAVQGGRKRTVASIARHAAKRPKWAQLLFRMVHYYAPLNILELGTSLGISTAYMALGNIHARVITCEGSAAIANYALRNFAALKLQNIRLVPGNFDHTLQDTLALLPRVDLAFIDGNHQEEPTVRYFHQILPKTHAASILIFDDIHWSAGMEAAWKAVCAHPSVRCTIDLFFMGLVFFNEDIREKQHFTIRF